MLSSRASLQTITFAVSHFLAQSLSCLVHEMPEKHPKPKDKTKKTS